MARAGRDQRVAVVADCSSKVFQEPGRPAASGNDPARQTIALARTIALSKDSASAPVSGPAAQVQAPTLAAKRETGLIDLKALSFNRARLTAVRWDAQASPQSRAFFRARRRPRKFCPPNARHICDDCACRIDDE